MYDSAQFQKRNTIRYERLLFWLQNTCKARMWLLYSRVPKMLLDWWLYVVCCYPTTPTEYPSTTRGISVGPSVAINIKFCGCLWFLSHSFVSYMGPVCHWQPFWSTTRVCFVGQCWCFNPQWTPEQAIVKTSSVRTIIVSWEKCTVTKCLRIFRCLWRV
jgi:hypothetical protein